MRLAKGVIDFCKRLGLISSQRSLAPAKHFKQELQQEQTEPNAKKQKQEHKNVPKRENVPKFKNVQRPENVESNKSRTSLCPQE
jgi:hypothetical protein